MKINGLMSQAPLSFLQS